MKYFQHKLVKVWKVKYLLQIQGNKGNGEMIGVGKLQKKYK